MVTGKSLQNISVGISLPKVTILSICMKDGGLSLLTQLMMMWKNISEMSKKQLNSWATVTMPWSTCSRPPCQQNCMAHSMVIITSLFFVPCLKTSMLRSHSPLPPHPPPPPQVLWPPFTLLRTPVRTPLKHTEDHSLEEKVNHLTEALY